MYLRLLTALVALAALVLSAVPARAQPDTPTGTIAIRASLCDAAGGNPYDCPAPDGFGDVSIATPDGRILTLADADVHGAYHVWDDDMIVFGTYFLDVAGIATFEGYQFDQVVGAYASGGGWAFDVTADVPNANLVVEYVAQTGGFDLDGDNDGLMDEEELEIGTDPTNPDTDGDRLSDGFEWREFGTDPLTWDTDGDGYGDGDELEVHKTDPLDRDTDEDGYGDGAEVDAGSDPRDATSIPVGAAGSTLVVDVRILPEGYEGNDYAGDSEPLGGVEVTVSIPASEWGVTDTTDANGRVVVEGLGEGVYNVFVHIPGEAADFLTFFAAQGDSEPRQHENRNTNNPAVYVGPDETLFGTFYVIPEDADAEPEPTKPAPPVTALPNTGTGPGAAENEETDGSATLALVLARGLAVVGAIAVGRKRRA